jgi:hypothetical protein
VSVDGTIDAADVVLNLACTNDAARGAIVAHWTGTRYEGTFTFENGARTGQVSITGWSHQADMPNPRFALAAAAANGVVYAIGGANGNTLVGTVDAYDQSTGMWSRGLVPMPTPREGLGAVTIGGLIYAVGGHRAGGIATGALEIYDPANGSWTTGASMPTPRAHLAVVTDGHYLYAIGGDTSGTNGGQVATVERYDPATNSWSTLAPMPAAGSFIAAGVIGQTIVVVGSGGSGGPTAATDVYDIATNSWHSGTPMPASRTLMAAGEVNGGLIVVGGTVNGSPAYDTWVYYPETAQQPEGWAGLGSIPTARSEAAVAVVDDVLYAIGGMTGGAAPMPGLAANDALSVLPFGHLSTTQGPGGSSDSAPAVMWSSSNPSVAQIGQGGTATGNTPGQTTIVASAGSISCEDSVPSGCATLTVRDTTPPFLNIPNGMTVEANNASGAIVTFFTSAFDNVDGPLPALCTHTSGSMFPFGQTTVDCSASDRSGNTAHGSFTVLVQDTRPPFLSTPNDQTREANSRVGAVVTYFVSANDSVDGLVTATCSPASGSSFGFGPTTVTCSATDAHGNSASSSFTITVQDTKPPFLSTPMDQTREAMSPAGAIVSYTAMANDSVDGPLTPTCAPASGSTFGFGPTTVSCSATDAHGNSASKSFTITVRDTTPPQISTPRNVSAEATSPNGAGVAFSVTASDLVDGPRPVSCTPALGSTFPLGHTQVTCAASDAAGNSATSLIDVLVVDTTAPVLTVPANIVTDATGPAGKIVTFSATATDSGSGVKSVTPDHASGSTFAVGTTTVLVTAVDNVGNSASASFTVTVLNPAQMLTSLIADVSALGLPPAGALLGNVQRRLAQLPNGGTGALDTPACAQLRAFVEVVREAGLPTSTLTALVTEATNIINTACR